MSEKARASSSPARPRVTETGPGTRWSLVSPRAGPASPVLSAFPDRAGGEPSSVRVSRLPSE